MASLSTVRLSLDALFASGLSRGEGMSDKRREAPMVGDFGVLSFLDIASRIRKALLQSEHDKKFLSLVPLTMLATILIAVAWIFVLLWNIWRYSSAWVLMLIDNLWDGPSDKTHPPSAAENHRETRRQIGGF